MKPLKPSDKLAAVVGSGSLPRSQAIKKVWAYIKRNDLQDKKNARNINADAKLLPLFGGKKQITMFQLTSIISKNLH
jgi:chromatin remodeling complex protein RSC6